MNTLAEQIAAVKDAIETYEAEALGYENGAKATGDDDLLLKEAALYRRSEAAMRAVLATLEGMAAPGETPRYPSAATAAKMAYWSGDSPSPQQPTQEATEDAMRRSQRLWYTRFDGKAKSPGWIITAYAEEITAATDEARREVVRQMRCLVTKNPCGTDTWAIGQPCRCGNCTLYLEVMPDPRFRALSSTPQNPGIKCAVYSQVPPYRMRCDTCLAAGRCLEASTRQNPGDQQ